jgi:molybdopterin converting factor small subunit
MGTNEEHLELIIRVGLAEEAVGKLTLDLAREESRAAAASEIIGELGETIGELKAELAAAKANPYGEGGTKAAPRMYCPKCYEGLLSSGSTVNDVNLYRCDACGRFWSHKQMLPTPPPAEGEPSMTPERFKELVRHWEAGDGNYASSDSLDLADAYQALTARLAELEADREYWSNKSQNQGDTIADLSEQLEKKDEEIYALEQEAGTLNSQAIDADRERDKVKEQLATAGRRRDEAMRNEHDSQAATAAMLNFMRTECDWESFRVETFEHLADEKEATSASRNNAQKLSVFLKDKPYGKKFLEQLATAQAVTARLAKIVEEAANSLVEAYPSTSSSIVTMLRKAATAATSERCLGCRGGSIHHTCGKEPSADAGAGGEGEVNDPGPPDAPNHFNADAHFSTPGAGEEVAERSILGPKPIGGDPDPHNTASTNPIHGTVTQPQIKVGESVAERIEAVKSELVKARDVLVTASGKTACNAVVFVCNAIKALESAEAIQRGEAGGGE